MSRLTTVRDVAREAGVHLSTAARALKNDPRISKVTIRLVRAAAKKLGYKPDPMMAAFAVYRQSVRPLQFHGTLAWVTNFPTEDGWHSEGTDLYFKGASNRAAELGYKVQTLWLREPGMTARRASNILVARGIRGLLICPQPIGRGHLSMLWDQFSAVAFGYSMVRPKLHLVTNAHFRSMVTAVRNLRALGYRRIGFYSLHHMVDRTDRMWAAAFETESKVFSEECRVPPLTSVIPLERDLIEWYRRWRPDVILTTEAMVPAWLKKYSLKVPGDVGVAFINLQHPQPGDSGVDERPVVIGRTAVDLLIGMVQRGERGIPKDPLRLLVEGSWVRGQSVIKHSTRK